MNIEFTEVTQPTPEMAAAYTKWENDPDLIYLSRPNQSQADLDKRITVTVEELQERLEHHTVYLIHVDGELIGEMDYQIDPAHLFKKEMKTAWIGINIGERAARGKGIGRLAIQHLEIVIKQLGIYRIELGVFEFNVNAIKLYQKLGYQEIGRIPEFTFWQDKMWTDIRMEKLF